MAFSMNRPLAEGSSTSVPFLQSPIAAIRGLLYELQDTGAPSKTAYTLGWGAASKF